MHVKNSKLGWKGLFKPARLIPFLTIIGAGTAIVLSLIDFIKLSTSENIVIALLALLAIDAFIERLSVLEKIEDKLSNLSNVQILKKRVDLLKPTEQAKHASEICILAVSAVSIISPYIGFYKNKMKGGCNLRVILLNPDSLSLETWNLLVTHTYTKNHTESTLGALAELMSDKEASGKCEVRLLNVFLPYSMFCVDMSKDSGIIQVEYHPYKLPVDDRPHIHLTEFNSPYWYNYYRHQFQQAWSDATPWNP